MTEDVSMGIRLAVTVCLIASAVAIASNVLLMSIGTMDRFRDSYVEAVNSSDASVLNSLSNFSSVESTVIYKVARESNAIMKIVVKQKDGSTKTFDWSDPNIDLSWFRENATKRFSVSIEVREGYILTCEEVDR